MNLAVFPEDEIERLYDAGFISDAEIEQLALSRVSPHDLAIIDAFAYGLAKLLNTPVNQLVAEASTRGNLYKENAMNAYAHVGAAHSYPEVASQAVRNVQQQNPSPVYGYLRTGSDQKIYLYPTLGEAQGWFSALTHGQQPHDYAAVFVATDLSRPVQGLESFGHALVSGVVGAVAQSYPEAASQAVRNAQQQSPSPVYGYLRTGSDQKVYLYQTLGDAQGWFSSLTHGQQPHDYAAVFVATDLSKPVQGLESFGGQALVSGEAVVGNFLPFLLGLPLGGIAGYFLRRWQEENPGHTIPGVPPGKLPAPKFPGAAPKTAGEWVGGPWYGIDDYGAPAIGGPWLDVVGQDYSDPATALGAWLDLIGQSQGGDDGYDEPPYTIGGPWLDVVGAQVPGDDHTRMRSWPQTKALIQSAISEVRDSAASAPAEAYVWSLDPPGPSHSPHIELSGTSMIVPFGSPAQALDYLRERIQTPHVALALFDRRSPHWPNPTNWTKSNDPSYERVIVQQIARAAPTRAAGDYNIGAWGTAIGSALDDVRSRAQSLANKRAGSVVGVIHTTKDGLWHALAFRDADDADDWLGTATGDPASYTYAAYYDKNDYAWPHPVNEKIGGAREASPTGAAIRRGAAKTSGDVWWAA